MIRHVDGGIITGRFTDHHVHLQLVDHTLLAGSRLGRVIDLGGNPAVLRSLASASAPAHFPTPEMENAGPTGLAPAFSLHPRAVQRENAAEEAPEPAKSIHGPGQNPNQNPNQNPGDAIPRTAIEYAGAFLTAPGGYPSDRTWAPEGAVREVTDAADAAPAVAELAAAGATCIKIVAHSEAGHLLDDESFRAVVAAASAHGMPVVAHAEGPGQAQRARRLGARRLAHAPFSERLSDHEIAAQAASVEWISTLAIHDDAPRAIAIDNVRRFIDAGGVILYGTDMGNGDTPVDLNAAEIAALREAGLEGIRLLRALAPSDTAALFLPDGDPVLARPLTPADLET